MDLANIFGGGQLAGLLSPDEQQQLQNQALLSAGLGILAGSAGGQRRGIGEAARPSLANSLLQGFQQGGTAYQTGAQNLIGAKEYQEKLAETKRKRQVEAELMKAEGLQAKIDTALQYGRPDIAEQYSKLLPKDSESPYAKIDPKDYTQESLQAFRASNDPAMLVPREKPQEAPSLTSDRDAYAFEMFGKAFNQVTPQQARDVNARLTQEQLAGRKAGATNVSVGMPTEGERTAGFLTNRIQGALEQINQVVTKNPRSATPNTAARAVELLTGSETLKNLTNPESRQRIESAQLDLLDAALTLGTGAAYTTQQLEGYRKSYFPQIGDQKETIADKQVRLNRLLQSARIKAGRATPADMGLPQGVTVRKVN